MIIDQDKCTGCSLCLPYCPVGAISMINKKAWIDLDVCTECGTCGRQRVVRCPTKAIHDQADLYDTPRAIAKYFSDPTTTHKATKVPGRGTEEVKTNDVTGRVKRGQVGVAVELGRPVLGTTLTEVEKVTRALRLGVDFEEKNPLTAMMVDRAAGAFAPEDLDLRMVSAIVELSAPLDRLGAIMDALREVAATLQTVFSLDVIGRFDPDGSLPEMAELQRLGLGPLVRPNAKVNLGLGRPLADDGPSATS